MSSELIEELQRKMEKQKAEITQLKQQLSNQGGSVGSKGVGGNASNFSEQILTLQKQLQSKDAELSKIKEFSGSAIVASKKEGITSSDLIQDLNSQIIKYKAQIQKQKEELAKFESLKTAEQQIEHLNNENSALQSELAQWKEDYNQKESQLLALQSQLEGNEMASQLMDAQNQIGTLQVQVTNLEQQIETQQGKITELRSDLAEAQNSLRNYISHTFH